jgi:tryptophan 2,3-dioxygenase
LKKTAEKHTIFRDISNLSTYIIPRSSLPKLPKQLKKELGFYYTHGK